MIMYPTGNLIGYKVIIKDIGGKVMTLGQLLSILEEEGKFTLIVLNESGIVEEGYNDCTKDYFSKGAVLVIYNSFKVITYNVEQSKIFIVSQ